jgi:hypothetical protein
VTLSAPSAQTVPRLTTSSLPSLDKSLVRLFRSRRKGVDFADVPDTVTFLPGQTTQTITVPVKGDLTTSLTSSSMWYSQHQSTRT